MGHTPYGYRTENGKAVIDEEKAQQIRNLYRNYLDGMALAMSRVLIDQQTYDRAQAERLRRAKVLGRTNRKKQSPDTRKPPTRFKLAAPEQAYDDPKQQAEYLYSLIESEAR